MIIDKTYFKYPILYLPQSTALGSGVSQDMKDLDVEFIDGHIDFYEPEFLKRVLGVPFYEKFIEHITPVVVPEEGEEVVSDIWTVLQSKLADATLKISPIANYVYFFAIANLTEKTSREGQSVSKNQTSSIISCVKKQVVAWNDMVERLITFYEWLEENKADYEAECEINLTIPFHYENSYGI